MSGQNLSNEGKFVPILGNFCALTIAQIFQLISHFSEIFTV